MLPASQNYANWPQVPRQFFIAFYILLSFDMRSRHLSLYGHVDITNKKLLIWACLILPFVLGHPKTSRATNCLIIRNESCQNPGAKWYPYDWWPEKCSLGDVISKRLPMDFLATKAEQALV
jgi:hypothetical protein